ncbi:pyrroloquinoline quinone biosynthesis protein PqqE [Oceanicella actignis]|uniref:PqqA peptide cyclase n=1 Tax=Oceanicella actignis TaxID=1189325 RepID=A0A1M7SWU5_9RHOB|nr:pyrroloquinoline quinone biosynthesis protein PqqE [Oceanicella actignis]TYO90575.1 pyrroloquinoline quinone biosynthesis protein E [Oceanicella actignis]SES74199.1 pyrroloquinoline quinone biosynthesis protein E [Oceanicella actignis]SHN62920.1 pyrroloquinoline quinone biosynthesis protein E [Oceanicella actignis]
MTAPDPQTAPRQAPEAPPPPIAMLAELTHRCPLSCPYCSNPLELTARSAELSAEEWADAFRQAAALGVLQLHLSGGEPASRRDLEQIVAAAVEAELYTNLITSGVGLTPRRLEALDEIGLDHVQLSLQGVEAGPADQIGGYRGGFARKMEVAREIARIGFPLTINAVMHRRNLDRLEETIELALRLGARRLEVACVQFHGWAMRSRAALLPTREQALRARDVVAEARERLRGVMVIDFVPPDYYAEFPKACMGGWGSTGLNVAPDGRVLPCHAAETIPGLSFDNLRRRPLAEIWLRSEAFAAFRGFDWMEEPCASCERKTRDFGGCRCQAQAMTGRASATDPTCSRSPDRAALDAALREAAEAGAEAPLVPRAPAPG